MKRVLLFTCLAAIYPASSATFTVKTTADTADAIPGNGACADANGKCSLRAAVMEANKTAVTDTIVLPAGTFVLSLGQLGITSPMTIRGTSAAKTIIAGLGMEGNFRVFDIAAGKSVQLRTLTVSDGFLWGDAGGCIRNAGTLALNTVNVGGCGTDSDGGAISNTGKLTIQGGQISGNGVWGESGGDVSNRSGATLIMMRVIVSGMGGVGISNGGYLEVSDSTFRNATWTPFENGGVIDNGGTAKLKTSTFVHNSSPPGRGHIRNSGVMTIANCTISDNDGGGPVVNNYSDLTVQNSTIYGNGTPGLWNNGSAKVKNSIIAGNEGGDCGSGDYEGYAPAVSKITSLGYNLIGDGVSGGCTFTKGPGDLVNVNPKLGPLANNGGKTQTRALLSGSLAIDFGSPAAPGKLTACEKTDQRGIVRPQAVRCDIGAYERRPGTPHGPEVSDDGPATEEQP